MLVKIHKTLLAQALGKVSRAANGRATMPILSNVLMTTEADGLRLAATNLEITISTWCACTVEEPGAITVPARLLAEVVGSLPAGEVTLKTLDESCTLRVVCGSSKTAIKGIDAQEFPPLPQPVGEAVEIDAAELRGIIQRVGFAAATDEARPSLVGINLTGTHAQATDGFRLAICPAALPPMLAARMGEVKRLATAGVVQVYKLAGSILWRCGATDLTTPLIDGRFPDANAVIPKQFKISITAETLALLAEVKRARMFADAVTLDLAGDVLTICAAGDETGAYHGEVRVEGAPDDAATVHFNGRFLAEALGSAGRSVTISIIDGKSPVVFTSPEVEGWKAAIMPVSRG